jgi:uncharacterized Zn-finger protein
MKAISFMRALFLPICLVMQYNSINAMKRQGSEITNYQPQAQPVPKKIKPTNQIANFFCNECPKGFTTERGLSYHRSLTHKQTKNLRERKFFCDKCPKNFCDNHGLKRHYRIHTGEKPFECDICFQPFRDKANCKKHRELHFPIEQQTTITYTPVVQHALIKAVNNYTPNPIINTYQSTQMTTYIPLELSPFAESVQALEWTS